MASCYLCISLSLLAQHLVNVTVTSDHLDSHAAYLGSKKSFQQWRVTWENRDLRREAKSFLLKMRHRWGAANGGGGELYQTFCFNLLYKAASTRAGWYQLLPPPREGLFEFRAAFPKVNLECMSFTPTFFSVVVHVAQKLWHALFVCESRNVTPNKAILLALQKDQG